MYLKCTVYTMYLVLVQYIQFLDNSLLEICTCTCMVHVCNLKRVHFRFIYMYLHVCCSLRR